MGQKKHENVTIDSLIMDLALEAMHSGKDKEEFRKFIEDKKAEKERIEPDSRIQKML